MFAGHPHSLGWAAHPAVLKLRLLSSFWAFGGLRMTAAFLKWVANGMIGLVMLSALWLAHAVNPALTELPPVQMALLAEPAQASSQAAR